MNSLSCYPLSFCFSLSVVRNNSLVLNKDFFKSKLLPYGLIFVGGNSNKMFRRC